MITDELEAWKFALEKYKQSCTYYYICHLIDSLSGVTVDKDTCREMLGRIVKEGKLIYPWYGINMTFPGFSRISNDMGLGREQRIGLIERFINELSKN